MENYFANEKKKRITGEELCLWRDQASYSLIALWAECGLDLSTHNRPDQLSGSEILHEHMPWWSGWRKLPEVKTAPVCRVWVLFRTAGTEWSLEDELGLLRQRIHFTHSPGILDPSDSMNALQILTCNSTAHLTFAQYIRQHVHEIKQSKTSLQFQIY